MKLREWLFGRSLNPLKPEARQHTLLAAFLAWIGLGADGLSSACYGPEAAYLALGTHYYLAIYLAIAITITVFIIALSYNQVIELFPSGGGGYKVATHLIGPKAGVVSGAALIVDYILTITISIAAGSDALFSLFPYAAQGYKESFELFVLFSLLFLNLRGMKESIMVLMPIFLLFVVSHVVLILYGIIHYQSGIIEVLPRTIQETHISIQEMGWFATIALMLRAYSLGAGTYTGIEAVSNNINRLEQPRVETGQWTMFYMAISLSFVASGIVLLYLLVGVTPVPGQTLNAVAFKEMMQNWVIGNINLGEIILIIVMFAEASLLFVAANTGYLGGPAVLSNMAADYWVPTQFRFLSSRLVTQNGIVLMGLGALFILLWTRGQVQFLLVMYSINVFLTFTLSLLGLSLYWWKSSNINMSVRLRRLLLSGIGFIITLSILTVIIVEKFLEGGWVTLLMTGFLIFACNLIKKHYVRVEKILDRLSQEFDIPDSTEPPPILPLNPKEPTAVFFVGGHPGLALHMVTNVLSLFPNQYKNFVFLSVGTIDAQNLAEIEEIEDAGKKVTRRLTHVVNYCRSRHLPAVHYFSYDIDIIEGLAHLAEKMAVRYPNCVFFSSTMVFENFPWLYQWLHNRTGTILQQRLNEKGLYMMLLPIQIPYVL